MDDGTPPGQARAMPRWPLALIASPAAVTVWSGWVGLGGLCGFGKIRPLPGLPWGLDHFQLNTAITLPVGIESYGAYALAAWLVPGTGRRAREFAGKSAAGALGLGMAGQVAYHLLAAAHATAAPWWVTMLVSCLPVATLALATALTHLLRTGPTPGTAPDTAPGTAPGTAPDRPASDTRPGDGWRAGPGTGPALPLAGTASPTIPVPVSGSSGPGSRRGGNGAGTGRPGGGLAGVEERALAELSADPGLSGAELARRLGVGERRGQRLVNRLAPQLPASQ